MGKKAFDKRVREAMGNQIPNYLTGGKWKGIAYSHIYLKIEDNFIDGKEPIKCDLKGNLSGSDMKGKYHVGANHVNSSQIMCMNFFKKFFEKTEWEEYLLTALRKIGVQMGSNQIENATFEFEPCHKEGTNFDFYMEMEDGSHISFEIKFTEPDFGGLNPDKNDPTKYDRKWKEIYSSLVDECPFLNCSKDEFYGNPRKKYYQINRNICYARKGDVVLFLTPKANNACGIDRGRNYIDSITEKYPNIRNIYWEELVKALMAIIDDVPELRDYYLKFQKKYIDVLS
ncbi:PGN_0703 family putative restriction endonuclease [Pseudobutyrivibrio xylanivorans]|uniref:Restriction endonuclease n=1 Tax=Pseudobutyrivibrio xylanivorans TaxID=185007 RepID=A0A5P6VL83_PSEXY|nr:hypothetical protein [Pseudobutyrivibrio xylanivorans]QFJ53423.1 hypothetical protein FXF36_00310 [Pseudobutyrivibrio xylanivorans]